MQKMQFVSGHIEVELLLGKFFASRLQVAPVRFDSLLKLPAPFFVEANPAICRPGGILVI